MANTQEILLTYRTDTGEVTKSLDEIVSGLSEVDKKLEETSKNTGGIGSGLKETGKQGKLGFQAIGTAIKATGIGLLVAIVAKLIQKFTENKKVAETLEVVFAAIGVVLNQIFEVVEPLGEALINAFKNPMETIRNIGKAIKENLINRFEGLLEFLPAIGKAIKLVFKGEWAEAGKVAADAAGKVVLGVENVTDKIVAAGEAIADFATDFVNNTSKAIKSSNDLVKAQQRLRDQQRNLNVQYAEARAEIEQLKQKRDDERLSIEERIQAAQEASEKDAEFAQKRMDIANAEVALVQREIALQGETVERLDQLAEARIKAAEAAESSAAVQTELMTSIAALQNEELARQQEIIDKEKERIKNIIDHQKQIDEIITSARSFELIELQEWYNEKKSLIDKNEVLLTDLEEAYNKKKKEINDKYDKEDLDREQAVMDAKFQMASNALTALMALNEAYEGETEAEQKRSFERNKKFSIAQAIITTAQAVAGQLAVPKDQLTGMNFIKAAIALATGVAQVATIKKTKFGGGETAGSSISTPTAPGSAGTAPQLDLGFLGAGAGQTGFRTYVISSEVSNAQQANQRINDQASLVG